MTDCTSDLIYQNQSGALNESFSDVLGSAAEHYAQANSLDSSVTADYYVGEDVYIPTDDDPGFRNMANPREDEDLDHFGELYTGTSDNGGVHSNSGIPNYAYFLLVNGGKNAGCSDSTHRTAGIGDLHTANCDISVNRIDISAAEAIFYLAFITLPPTATMADARNATETVAGALVALGLVSARAVNSTTAAWDAVGVGVSGPPPTSPAAPGGLAATGMSSSQIDLTWTDNANHEVMFKVERSDDGGTTFVQIATVGANVQGYSDNGLAELTAYHSRVMASNDVGDSTYSNSDGATTAAAGGGTAPAVTDCSPNNANKGQRLTVDVRGSNFVNEGTVDFGDRVNVQEVTFVSSAQLEVRIRVHGRASSGSSDVTITNPDGLSGTAAGCFTVNP